MEKANKKKKKRIKKLFGKSTLLKMTFQQTRGLYEAKGSEVREQCTGW